MRKANHLSIAEFGVNRSKSLEPTSDRQARSLVAITKKLKILEPKADAF